jgi:hypothetical protein
MLIYSFQTFIRLDLEFKMATSTCNLMGENPIRSWVWVTFYTHGYVDGKNCTHRLQQIFGYKNYELIPFTRKPI